MNNHAIETQLDLSEMKFKTCIHCNKTKPIYEFRKSIIFASGRDSRCMPCVRAASRKLDESPERRAYKAQYGARYRTSERGRAIFKKHEEWRKTQRHLNPNMAATYLLYAARRRAREKGIEFCLELSDILIPAICPVLGIPIKVTPRCCGPQSPSLDRIDRSRGYVKGNVAVISFKANTIKNDATIDELTKVLKYMHGLKSA